jgi:hypothetical protein
MNPSLTNRALPVPSQLRVLLVEPDQDLLASRAVLLTSSNYLVATASSHGEIFDLRRMTEIHLAVLSDTLGRSGLCSVAQDVREQWPSARILVLGTAQLVLEDHLYDEAVDHGFQAKKLLDTLARLSENPWNQTLKFIGSGPETAACPDEWLTFLRSLLPESDPITVTLPWQRKNPQAQSSGRTYERREHRSGRRATLHAG